MRPARALIDLAALRHNYRFAKARHGGRALAVVKANAYGHGVIPCSRALAPEADGFAVAFTEEAVQLREAGVTQPVLLLEGPFDTADLSQIEAHALWPVIHHEEQLRLIETAPLERPLDVWLKVNSGMNRVGFVGDAVAAAYKRLQASGKIGAITLMTHFARADELDSAATQEQLERFEAHTRDLPGARSLSNSGAILGWPQTHRDWCRPGILLYGADPMPDAPNPLLPVMSLESRIIATRELQPGQPLGYGARFVAERPTRVGLVAMGYADGYPRSVPNGTPVAVDGQLTGIIGRVSMDMLTVDLTDLPLATIGSRVELWGKQVSVNRVAEAVGTISYELLCKVKRVAFEYLETSA